MTLRAFHLRMALPSLLAAVAFAGAATAGGSMGDDDHDDSRHVIGVVRDLGAGPLGEARIAATLKGSGSSFIVRSDSPTGRYRVIGLAADLDPADIDITCSKDGYRHVRTVLRNKKPPPEAPIEADCLMERQ